MKKLLVLLIILGLASISFGNIYYVDVADGLDANDGSTEEEAFASLQQAMLTMAAHGGIITDPNIIYVQASGKYTAQADTNDSCLYISDIGGGMNPTQWVGYSSTIYDGGIVEVNAATNTLANCVETTGSLTNTYNIFRNFRFTGASGHGVALGTDDGFIFINCKFDLNGGDGLNGGDNLYVENSLFLDNTGDGMQAAAGQTIKDSIFFSNTLTGLTSASNGRVFYCVFAENLLDQIVFTSDASAIVDNCTFDGNDVANSDGVAGGGTGGCIITNSIFNDCAKGVNMTTNRAFRVDRNNCYWSCGAANTNWPDPTDADAALRQTFTAGSDPFVSTGSITAYALNGTAGTVAKYGALDAVHCATFWNSYPASNPPTGANAAAGYNDIGAKQRVDPAGGGGGKVLGGGVVR